MHDPIEGQFRVVGQAQRDPIIKNWRNLFIFLAVFVVAVAARTWQIESENERRAAASNTGWSATADQPTTLRTHQ